MNAPKDSDYIPYREKPEWEDIIPVPQDDGPHPLAPIAYSYKYTDTLDTFRAICMAEEISERALTLTQTVIELSPAHYTVWLYRQRLLTELKIDLSDELDFLDELAENNPKCYQLWQHRQFVVDRLNSADRENEFFGGIMEEDSKNFHAWTFRQWLINRFDLWDAELPLCEELLDEDVRNNSAWNQRFYVLTNNPHAPLTEEIIQQEVEFATSKISVIAFNECPWNYLKGLYIRYYGKDAYKPKLLTVANSLKEQGIKSRHLLAWFVDIYSSPGMGDVSHGIEACKNLISADFVRSKYWTFQLEKLQAIAQ